MAVTLVNKTSLEKAVDVSNVLRELSLPAAAVAGNAIVVLASGWNYAESGEIIGSVQDDGGNTYSRIATITVGSSGRAEAWLAKNVAAATDIGITPSVANGSTRITWQALQFGGVDPNPLDQSGTNYGGLNSTGFSATTPATTTADQAVVALLSTLWPDSPKSHGVTSGYTTIDSHADTTSPANSMGYLASWKTVGATGAQSAAWTYSTQSQGAQGLIFTLKAGSSTGYRVRVSGKDPQAIGASSCIYQIHKAPADPANALFGDLIHRDSGYTMIDDGTGNAGMLVNIPGSPSVTVGEQVIVIVRGLTGGQSWGSHRWVGVVEAIPA